MSPRTTFSQRRTSSSIRSPWTEQWFPPEQRFLEDVDYDDAAIGEMRFNAYREQVYHSQRDACLLVSRRRQCRIERSNMLLKQWQKATIERCRPLIKQVKNKTLNKHRLGLFWTDRGSKASPTVRRRLEDTNSRVIMTEEENKN